MKQVRGFGIPLSRQFSGTEIKNLAEKLIIPVIDPELIPGEGLFLGSGHCFTTETSKLFVDIVRVLDHIEFQLKSGLIGSIGETRIDRLGMQGLKSRINGILSPSSHPGSSPATRSTFRCCRSWRRRSPPARPDRPARSAARAGTARSRCCSPSPTPAPCTSSTSTSRSRPESTGGRCDHSCTRIERLDAVAARRHRGGADRASADPRGLLHPQFNLGGEVVHSLEATHVGYVAHPANFTFTMTVKAIGGASASLTQLAMRGQEFSIGLYEAKGSTGQWDFKSILFNKCLITSANPSNAVPNAAPTATFSGVAREAVVDDGIERTLPTPIT